MSTAGSLGLGLTLDSDLYCTKYSETPGDSRGRAGILNVWAYFIVAPSILVDVDTSSDYMCIV